MDSPPTPLDRARVGLVILAAGFAVASCTVTNREGHALQQMKFDGSVKDWPAQASIAMDEHFAYFRVSVENEQFALQAAPETVAVALDIDGDSSTGRYTYLGKDSKGREQKLGIDFEIQLSPLDDAGGVAKKGVAFYSMDTLGKRTLLAREPRDVMFTPTYAAPWYEFRLSRHIVSAAHLPQKGLFSTGLVKGTFCLLDRQGSIVGYADPFGISSPPAPAASDRPFVVTEEVPRQGPDELRIMSYNVYKSRPLTRPETFKRIFESVNPDIVLVQEWDGDVAVLKSWFTALVPSPTAWSVVASPQGDVAIISRHGTFRFGSESAPAVEGMPRSDKPWSPRWVGATVETPLGKIAVGSVHMKCCGSSTGPEDELRRREAQSINEAMAAGLTQSPANMIILGGDLNLVGSRPPLDMLRAQLDHGDDLLVVDPTVLGDTAKYTWVDGQSEFSAGRLDYLTYSASTMELTRAFVLDTQIMSDEALFRSGLAREDTLGSDHLPVIIDVKPLPSAMMQPAKR